MSDEPKASELPKPSEFHGYSIMPVEKQFGEKIPCGPTATQLHIGYLPHRKGLCLYVAETNRFMAHVEPLAYFKTKEAARTLQKVLDWMILKSEPK